MPHTLIQYSLMLFWLLLLGLMTYILLRRTVIHLTQTPLWMLWLVMMAPAIIWYTWVLMYGAFQPFPPDLILPFLICPFFYWFLFQWGRRDLPATPPPSSRTHEDPRTPILEANPEAQELATRPISIPEETTLRNCFPWTVYALRHLEYRPQAVICRGQLRSNPEVAYRTVRENVETHFGKRFLVLFQNSFNGKPFFALVANPYEQKARLAPWLQRSSQPWLALSLLVITLFTTTVAGAINILELPKEAVISNLQLLWQGLSYSLPLMLILGVHETGHYIAARAYQIQVTLPYFIPFPYFLGTFGAFISMQSPIPHRKALFDVSLAGPVAGLIITLPCLVWGLMHSATVPLTAESGILAIQSLNPRFSTLLVLISKFALGNDLIPQTAIHLHPVAVAGYVGLILTAFNLIPIGQLDGGHIVHAVFGQRASLAIGQITRLIMLVLAILHPELIFWAILLFLIPLNDEPALNDVTELDDRRDLLGLLSLAFLVLMILPMPPILSQWLNV